MELQELYELMDRFAQSGLTDLEWSHEGESIALRRSAPTVMQGMPAPIMTTEQMAGSAVIAEKEQGETVKAPLVGVFYLASAPGEAPFAPPGKQVKKGDTICLIEAMKMMSEIPAPADCVVEAVLARDGEAVGYQEPLFRIRRV